jgi:hypothetical protein
MSIGIIGGRPRFQPGPTSGKEPDFGDGSKQPRSGIAGETCRETWPLDQGWHR